jgi:O-antigen ligase
MDQLSSRENLYFQLSLGLYGVGVGVSQSLMSLGSVLLIGFFLYLLVLSLRDGSLGRDLSKIEKFTLGSMVLYVLWLLGVWLMGPMTESRQSSGLELFPLLLIPLLALLPRRARPSNRALCVIGAALVISYGTALYQGFVQGRMAIGFMKNPIYFAYNILFPLVALALMSTHAEALGWKARWVPKLCLGLLGLSYLALLATNSRTAFVVATLCLMGLILPWAWKRFSKIYVFAIVIIAGTFAVSEYLRKPYVRERVAAITNLNDLSWQGRLKAWEHNVALIKEYPLSGVGPKQNALLTKEHPEWQGLWGPDVAIFAHNIYLQALAESGIVGFLLLLIGFVGLGLSRPLTSGVLVALALGGLTENVMSNSKPLHALLLSLLVLGLLSPPYRTNTHPTLAANSNCAP